MSAERAAAFLRSFAAIEQHLRVLTGAGRTQPFYALVERAARRVPAVARLHNDLKEYADLRNAIVHERGDGRLIAEPTAAAVEELARLEQLLLQPPTVLPLFQQTVQSLDEQQPVAEAVTRMAAGSYSQLPVTRGGRFVALLTANTVTRWLGACVADDLFSLQETRIATVLQHAEHDDNHLFVGRDSDLFAVLDAFEDYERRGRLLDAVLISERGRPDEALLGIITLHDLPRVLALLDGRTARPG